MNNIQAIIFDADGMIITGERLSNRLAKDYDIPLKETELFFKKEFQECLTGKSDLREVLLGYLEQWNWKGSLDDLLNYWFSNEHNLIDERLIQVIEKLREQSVKTYLATNNEKYRTSNLIETRGLGKWFDYIFSSAEMGSKKPDSTFFQSILDKTKYKKEEIMFWDDDVENVRAAQKFGLRSELYEGFEKFEEKISSFIRRKETETP